MNTNKTTAQLTVDVANAVAIGKQFALTRATEFLNVDLGGNDQFPCGFAWVVVPVKGNTKLGKAFLANGFRKQHGGGLSIWNPSGMMVQNVNCLAAGAEAFAATLRDELGVKAFADSRWD